MKNYLVNKDFIPKSFIQERKSKINKSNRIGLIYLVILNLVLLPITFNKISSKFKKEVNKDTVVVEKIETPIGINPEEIISWIKLIDKEIVSINIRNNSGEIKVSNNEKIYFLEKEIPIKSVTKNNDDSFIISIN